MSEKSELVSVLLPVGPKTLACRQARRWLTESIESLLVQSHKAIEILLVLPFVTRGNAGEIYARQLHDLLPCDSRLRLLERPATGIVSALNSAIEAAGGEWLARMDADDIAHPDRILIQLQYLLANPDIGLCSTGVEIFTQNKSTALGNQKYQQWLNTTKQPSQIAENIYIESPCPHPTWMMHKSVASKLEGYRDSEWAEDYDFLLRAHLLGIKMGKPLETPPLIQWRDHTLRLTRNDARYNRTKFAKAKAWALSESLLKDRHAVILGTGKNAKRMFDALKLYGVNVDFFVDLHEEVKNKSPRNTPVINYDDVAARKHGDALIISVVTRFGAREQLQQWFKERKFSATVDYLFAG